MGKLDGRAAIVTGASRGLGKDIALALAREGAAVIVAARTEGEGQSRIPGTLDHTVELIRSAGGTALAARCDVTSEDDIAATVQKAVDSFGRLDILVNNAGVLIPGRIMEIQPRHWNLVFRVNVNGPFLFCRAAIPVMARTGGGHIINISSRGALGPGPGPYKQADRAGTPYGSSKAALERFSQGLASEVYQDRISVNALSPHRSIWTEGGHYFRTQAGGAHYQGWRMNGDIFGDAAVTICAQEPGVYTGHILYDELVVQNPGGMSEADVMRRYPLEG